LVPSGKHQDALDVIGHIIELSRDGYSLSDRAVQFCRNHPADAIQPFIENMLAWTRLGHQRSRGIKMSISEMSVSVCPSVVPFYLMVVDRRAALVPQSQTQRTPQLISACADLEQKFDTNVVGWWRMMEMKFTILTLIDEQIVAQNMTYPRFDYRGLEGDWQNAKNEWYSLSRTFTVCADNVCCRCSVQ
jgi:hypothetical protein